MVKDILMSELLKGASGCYCRGSDHLDETKTPHCRRRLEGLKETIYFIYGSPMCRDCFINCVKYGEVDVNLDNCFVVDDVSPILKNKKNQ